MIKNIAFTILFMLFVWIGYAIDFSLVHMFQGLLGPEANGVTLVILWIAVLIVTITPIIYISLLLAAVIVSYFDK